VQQRGHEVTGIVVEPVASGEFIQDLDRKLGISVLARKLARTGLNWLRGSRARVAGHSGLTGMSAAADSPRVYVVKSHNSPECASLLRSLAPDVLFLRGCGIIRPVILEIPTVGVLNAHYGELPKYQGVYATEWAVLHGDRPVITMHFVDAGVDSGEILATRPVPIERGATLASLRDESSRVGGELLVEVLDGLQDGTLEPQKQNAAEGVQYFSMHPRIYSVAERKFRRFVTYEIQS
jgi:methionyl-tRNA formyltransferase